MGETKILVKTGELTDEGMIRKVSEPNPDYILKEKGAVLNWWDIIHIDAYADLNTKLAKILDSVGIEKTQALMATILGPAAQPQMLQMLNAMTVMRLITLINGTANIPMTKEQLMALNAELNKIPIQ